jgi:hypothetical protein
MGSFDQAAILQGVSHSFFLIKQAHLGPWFTGQW